MDANDNCICKGGYFYTPGTNGKPGNCTQCNATSFIAKPGLVEKCAKCPPNQRSDYNDYMICSCPPKGFTYVGDKCLCPPGHRYYKNPRTGEEECK